MTPKAPWLIIGIGNEYRQDDGAGLFIARELKKKGLPSLRITEASGEGTDLMERWKPEDSVILIDAVNSGERAGILSHFDVLKKPLPSGLFLCSSHAFGVAEAVELSRSLQQLPRSLWLYGVEGKCFNFGTDLSPEVQDAIPKAVEWLLEEILKPE